VTDAEETTGQAPEAAGLDVQLAAELIERAKAQGVSLVGPDGLLAGITKTVLQAALDAEMTEHLGYEKGERPSQSGGNHRNGHSPKTVLTEVGPVPLQVPRDRAAQFEPRIVPKHARRIEGLMRVGHGRRGDGDNLADHRLAAVRAGGCWPATPMQVAMTGRSCGSRWCARG
jgi:hypothetical protein